MVVRFTNRPVLRCGLVLLLVAGCATPTGEGFVAPAQLAVLFFADGMDAGVLRKMLDAGELPAIEQRFAEGGVTVDFAVACMPSITYPNAVSLITGRFPGHHGVLGNRWFDRHTLRCRDYGDADTYRSVNEDFSAPTIYDALHDRFTVNVQDHTRRGVTYTFDHVLSSGIDWGLGWYSEVDRRVGQTIDEIERLARQTQRWPILITFYFPGLDEIGHRNGSDSAAYRAAMQVVDASIGRVFDKFERLGLIDRTTFALVTDHGHVPIRRGKRADIESWLRNVAGLSVYDRDMGAETYPERLRELGDAAAFVINGGKRRIAIHLRCEVGWQELPTQEAVEHVLTPRGQAPNAPRLDRVNGVALVAVRAGHDAARLFSRRGKALVERRQVAGRTEYRYTVTNGDEPLGYLDDPTTAAFVRAGWHASREWLDATVRTDFPDTVPQVVEMFDSTRAGDIVVFAADGWSFHRHDRGGHGSCIAHDMLATYFFSGRGLPAGGHVETARLVDVMPTLLDLMGESARLGGLPPIDGVSIADELHSATVKTR